MSGTVTGTVTTHPGASMGDLLTDLHLQVTITAGTGGFEGAVGTAVYDDHETIVGTPDDFGYEVHGEGTGSFDVPS